MRLSKFIPFLLGGMLILGLYGCNSPESDPVTSPATPASDTADDHADRDHGDHADHDHSDHATADADSPMAKMMSGLKELSPEDHESAMAQHMCPVSGQPLGSMGKPPKIMIGDKSLFVCCAGCIKKVEASPDQYLTKYYTAKGEQVREGVFKSTLADAAAIAAQKTCPVMDEPLGGMGVPGKVNVNGKAVYICCPGCAKKLVAEPDKYLADLKANGITPPAF